MKIYRGAEDKLNHWGLFFGPDIMKCQKLNWELKIEAIEREIRNWKKRQLSIIGRITVGTSLLISKITYIAATQSSDKNQIKILARMLYNFIWDGKKEKVKSQTLIGKYDDGGLNMIDVESHIQMLKMVWIKRLCNTSSANWMIIPKCFCDQFGEEGLIFKSNNKDIDLSIKTDFKSNFYVDIIFAWKRQVGVTNEIQKTIVI